MVERGRIVKIKGDNAVVRFDRRSACDSCHMCAVTRDGMKVDAVVKNTLNRSVGDEVSVAMGERFVLTAAVIVYIIPLLFVGMGIGLGMLISELAGVIFASVGLVIGFIIAIVIDKFIRRKKGFSPTMIEDDVNELNGITCNPFDVTGKKLSGSDNIENDSEQDKYNNNNI